MKKETMQMKDFYEVLPKDMKVLLTDEDNNAIVFEGEARDIPDKYDRYVVVGTGMSTEVEMLFQLSKNKLS